MCDLQELFQKDRIDVGRLIAPVFTYVAGALFGRKVELDVNKFRGFVFGQKIRNIITRWSAILVSDHGNLIRYLHPMFFEICVYIFLDPVGDAVLEERKGIPSLVGK